MSYVTVLIVGLMFLVLCIVIVGVVVMASGKSGLNKQYTNKLMVLRVVVQASIVVLVALLCYLKQ